MKTTDHSQLVSVFSGDRMEAEIIAGMLQSHGIESMLKDESLGAVTSPYLMAGGNVKILVRPEDRENARKFIENPDAGELPDGHREA